MHALDPAPAVLAIVATLLLAASSGCPATPGPGGSSGPAETCTELGQQCRLQEGLLGVCTATDEPGCESPPCLRCVGQH